MKKMTLLLLLYSLAPACIELRIDDDGSRDLGVGALQYIKPFDLADTGIDRPARKSGDLVFAETDATKLKQQLHLGKKTWVYVWGSWCSPCRQKLPFIAQVHRDHPDWNILPVADDYDIAELQALLFSSQLLVQPYILDFRKYGTRIYEKERQLWNELALGGEYHNAVPQNYLFDETGKLLYYGPGAIPAEIMKRYFTDR